jgi:hypothetical protein
LSLNAAKNWQQNSGAKRLDSKSGGMAVVIAYSARSRADIQPSNQAQL